MSSQPPPPAVDAAPRRRGLGLDGGGTQTRWAVADGSGAIVAEGHAAGLSGLQLATAQGRAEIVAVLRAVFDAAGPVQCVRAGLTGIATAQLPELGALLAAAAGVEPSAVRAASDIELCCAAAFDPGEGYVVYAGTGSIAAYIDAAGLLHRAGGRGVVIDDAGGGHWIAREALRAVWRAEDLAPGAWQRSPLAQRVFEQVGGSDWGHTRAWAYGADRGRLGLLALAVAAAADFDPVAQRILRDAGTELARLAQALLQRFGSRPLALAGRVFELHPLVESSLRAALPPATEILRLTLPAHHAAARLALRADPN